jgi:hypothetical protein
MLRRAASQLRVGLSLAAVLILMSGFALGPSRCCAQNAPPQTGSTAAAMEVPAAPTPDEPTARPVTPLISAAAVNPTKAPVMINGRPYVRPTPKEQFIDYLKNSYGLPALVGTAARASYGQAMGKPEGWGQDWPGFGQRFGTAAAVTAIDGNVRYGLEMLFHEDMRYIPCHGCSKKRKLENALLAEVTARHDSDGHRFFTLTPTITDMAGPIIANAYWVPGKTAIDGFVGSRLIFATRISGHLFTEFVLERRHHDPPLPD